jgi:hypothetical protein
LVRQNHDAALDDTAARVVDDDVDACLLLRGGMVVVVDTCSGTGGIEAVVVVAWSLSSPTLFFSFLLGEFRWNKPKTPFFFFLSGEPASDDGPMMIDDARFGSLLDSKPVSYLPDPNQQRNSCGIGSFHNEVLGEKVRSKKPDDNSRSPLCFSAVMRKASPSLCLAFSRKSSNLTFMKRLALI